jgi:F-type H+-transporting ATPase subunit epsilon
MVDHNHRTLQCVVVTPERALLDETVDFVVLPLYDGELGVLPGRAPLIGRLGPGELRIRHGTTTQRFYIDGGFAQVRGDVVTVLTPQALRADEIDAGAARAALEPAQGVAATAEARAERDKVQQRARAQLRIVAHEGGGVAAAGGH